MDSHDQNNLFEAFFQAASDAYLVINDLGNIEYTNAMCLLLFGYVEDELIGQKIEMLLPERVRSRHENHRANYVENPQTRAMGSGLDLYARHKDGHEFAVDVGLFPVQVGRTTYYAAAIRDITDIKKREKKLHDAMRVSEQFVYIASHDLQEPLNNIKQFLALLGEKSQTTFDDDTKMLFENILGATEKMSSLITDLLEFSKVGQKADRKPVDCQKILETVLEKLKQKIEENHAVVTCSTQLPQVIGYESAIALLFYSLIDNSIKYKKENEAPKIMVTYDEGDDMYTFSISDNGIGMDENHTEEIFQMFTRLHRKDEYSGNGVGLANCKKAVELHGGRLWVDASGDNGTTFHFTLRKKI